MNLGLFLQNNFQFLKSLYLLVAIKFRKMYVFGTEAFETIINARGRDLVRNGIGSPKSCLVVLLFVAQSLIDLRLLPACSGSDEVIPILT